MDDNKTVEDSDEDRILTKLNGLLSKYQRQHRSILNTREATLSIPDLIHANVSRGNVPKAAPDKIPLLTEKVMLRPLIAPHLTENSPPLRSILDAALKEANIAMNVVDRGALVRALHKHLIRKPG